MAKRSAELASTVRSKAWPREPIPAGPGGGLRAHLAVMLRLMAYVNQAVPPGLPMKADPTSAAIGEVAPGRSIEDVEAMLVEGGVPADRIHFLSGEGGIAFLDDLGSWFSRLVSQTWHDAKEALASGKVLVGVFDVDKVDAHRIRVLLQDAGVHGIRSSGTWTWSE